MSVPEGNVFLGLRVVKENIKTQGKTKLTGFLRELILRDVIFLDLSFNSDKE